MYNDERVYHFPIISNFEKSTIRYMSCVYLHEFEWEYIVGNLCSFINPPKKNLVRSYLTVIAFSSNPPLISDQMMVYLPTVS